MICPRCDSDAADLLVKSTVDNAWEVYMCSICNFTWRSTESEDVKNPSLYDKRFKINPNAIPKLTVIPPVPKMIK
jgi:vanillate/4-hydroxybenzoate decarboxylase subunit D